MLDITPEQKRQTMISNALVLYVQENPRWFDEIAAKMDRAIGKEPGNREKIVLRWILSAEQVGSETVKDQILRIYG